MAGERLLELAQNDPETLSKLLNSLRDKVVIPHEFQKPVVDSRARFKVVNCGRRWGKTVIAAKIFVSRSREPKQMLWWVAPTYKVVKRGYRQVLQQLPDGVLTHEPPPETNFDAGRSVILHFRNGTRMEFYSAERPQGMLGEGVHFVVMDEAATMPSNVWYQIVRPTLADHQGGALMISTPRGRNWFYRSFQRGQDPNDPRWESWRFPSYTNPTLAPSEIEDMRRELPRLLYEQEVLAKFIAAGSSVFLLEDTVYQRDIVKENNLVEGVKPSGHVMLGVDLAKTNDWTVIYGARTRDRKNCYFERMQALTWPEQKRRIRRAARTLLREGATGVTLIMDSTGVGDPIVDDLEELGYDVIGLNATRYKNNMVKLLAKDLEESRAYILEDGNPVEFENYAMNITPGGRLTYSAPEGEHDDVVYAKMLQHWGIVNEGVPDASILSGDSPLEPIDEQSLDETQEDDFSDLLDDDESDEPTLSLLPPTPAELLMNPNIWSSGY